MKNKRLFLGFPVDKILTTRLENFKKYFGHDLTHIPGFKWVAKSNFHLTLLFIGSVPAAEIPEILKKCEKVFSESREFDLTTKFFTVFPYRKPRMIWLEFERSEIYENLVEKIHRSIFGQTNGKRALPHITLARFKGRITPDLQWPVEPPINLSCRKVNLYESDLKPGGAVYRIMKSYELKSRLD